jgi:hypothetical protein
MAQRRDPPLNLGAVTAQKHRNFLRLVKIHHGSMAFSAPGST